jgi:RNA polymerase primary sigma factor
MRGAGVEREQAGPSCTGVGLEERNRRVVENQWLVGLLARGFRGRGLGYEDLCGHAQIGLIEAAERYDPSFGTRFSTYASYWIKQAMRQAIALHTRTIRVPVSMQRLLARWRQAEQELRQALGEEPTPDQVAERLGLSESDFARLCKGLRALAVATETDEARDGASLLDATVADRCESPDARAIREDERRVRVGSIERLLQGLSYRDRRIVRLRFGLDGGPPLTPRAVAERTGTHVETIRSAERRALNRMAGLSTAGGRLGDRAGDAGRRDQSPDL